jgi:plasmid stabilization system protein ParE
MPVVSRSSAQARMRRAGAASRAISRPGVRRATCGRHSIFFEADDFRILVVRVLHDRMDYRPPLGPP